MTRRPPRSIDAQVDAQGVGWDAYPFPGASVHPQGRVAWSALRDFDAHAHPPEVRTPAGETLFVSARQREELIRHATAAGIPLVRREDVWDLLLDPFLDTSHDAPWDERVGERLARMGVSPRVRDLVRRRFAAAMHAYNAIHWEWAHLGLCDLLEALGDSATPRIYRWVMAIAERGRSMGPPEA